MSNDLQALLAATALASALIGARFLRADRMRFAVAIALAAIVAAASAWSFVTRPTTVPEQDVTTRPAEVAADGYVSSSKCRACHPQEYSTWHDSYHRTMTQPAGPDSVIGDFDDVHLEIDGKHFQLQRRGDEYFVELDDPFAYLKPKEPPQRVTKRIALTTGSHNMQAYWYETGHTQNLGMLPFTWLVAEGRWISRRSAFVGPATDAVEDKMGIWNIICLKCHATHARPRIMYEGNVQLGAFTQVAEFGIACEACHGPAEAHIAANQNPARRYWLNVTGEPDPTIVNPKRLDPERSTQVCGQCHASLDYRFTEKRLQQWFRDGFRYRPGDDLLAYRTIKADGDEQFWPDGLIRVAGREYNSMVGSSCHDQGSMTCLSCHTLHQPDGDTRPRDEWANDQLHDMDGDQNCLQCHESYAADIPAHSHHAAGSEGSRCQNCHMPYTTYGLMKGVRNHRIASPSVQSTLATGRANACNQCHLDRTLQWTATNLHDWFGTEIPELSAEDREVAASVQWALKGDAPQRALAAWSFGWQSAQRASGKNWMVPYLAELIDDPYEVVRHIAERSLRSLPGFEDFHNDLIGKVELRQRAKAKALEIWQAQPAVAAERHEHVLFAPDGAMLVERFLDLLRRRDHRVFRLFE